MSEQAINDLNPASTGLLSSSSSSSSSGYNQAAQSHPTLSSSSSATPLSYSLRAKQKLILAQSAEIGSSSGMASELNELSNKNSCDSSNKCDGNSLISGKDNEKENDSCIAKDDSNNTLLVRVAISDQSLQVKVYIQNESE